MRAPHLKLDSKNNDMSALITFKWGARGQFCLKFDAVFCKLFPKGKILILFGPFFDLSIVMRFHLDTPYPIYSLAAKQLYLGEP